MIDRWIAGIIIALLVIDAYYTRRWLRQSRRELEEIQRRASREIRGEPLFKMPNYCGDCGAHLLGGMTKHRPGCEIQALIDMAKDRTE